MKISAVTMNMTDVFSNTIVLSGVSGDRKQIFSKKFYLNKFIPMFLKVF